MVVGAPIFIDEHIESILDSLPNDYGNFIIVVTLHSNSYFVDEIEVLILAQE